MKLTYLGKSEGIKFRYVVLSFRNKEKVAANKVIAQLKSNGYTYKGDFGEDGKTDVYFIIDVIKDFEFLNRCYKDAIHQKVDKLEKRNNKMSIGAMEIVGDVIKSRFPKSEYLSFNDFGGEWVDVTFRTGENIHSIMVESFIRKTFGVYARLTSSNQYRFELYT